MTRKPNGYRCEACGEPATRMTADDVPLCEGDYQHILEHWIAEKEPEFLMPEVCPKCGNTGAITTPLDLTASIGKVYGTLTTACDCPAGDEWNRKATRNMEWPAGSTPNYGGWNNR